MGGRVELLLITANVGSVCDKPEELQENWMQELFKTVCRYSPLFLALHWQEVGGKDYQQNMKRMDDFVRTLMQSREMSEYDKVRVYIDSDFTEMNSFTALGSLYFVHRSLDDVWEFDFQENKFQVVCGTQVYGGSLKNASKLEKEKFVPDFWPDFKWTRKGFMRSRWKIQNCAFDLVNIHLFHDASNLVACDSSPSVYAENRRKALNYVLERLHDQRFPLLPFFVFGDFNFRLDVRSLLQNFCSSGRLQRERYDSDGKVEKIICEEKSSHKVNLKQRSINEQQSLYNHISNIKNKTQQNTDIWDIVQAQWKVLNAPFQLARSMTSLYPIPDADRDSLYLLVLDVVVLAIAKRLTVVMEGGSSLRDPQDRRMEALLKQNFDIVALVVQAAICGGLMARACFRWAEHMLDMESSGWALVNQEIVKIELSSSYLSDAMYDLLWISAKSLAFGVATRCTLWLCGWSANSASKSKLSQYPFKGSFVFGEELDKSCFSLKRVFFECLNQDIFRENYAEGLLMYDKEPLPFLDTLSEQPVVFPPSYPYSEDCNNPTDYEHTRCPAWCDRVFMSYSAKSFLQEEKDDSNAPSVVYGTFGDSVCMGDHKPVFLFFRLKPLV
uniref:inositol-polyphosphate 5-phosphatase n=1 Tax=Geotrypetes seraphini TaxID=260995 RepID=A0A6P8RKV3_GEOSA|nr:inositol polyphosphate-5-phosphatase A-like [Geotrypetes seraphini]